MLHLLSRYYNNSWITVSVRAIENQTPFVMIILQKLLGGLYSLCKTNASQLSRCHKKQPEHGLVVSQEIMQLLLSRFYNNSWSKDHALTVVITS